MAVGITNRGKRRLLEWATARVARPAAFYVALLTSASAPTVDTELFDSPLTEIAAGNGYTAGGQSLTPGATDFDDSNENDTSDYGWIQIKDVLWTGTGGPIPSSGSGARYAIFTDNNATQTLRDVIAWWDLSSDRSVSQDQTLTLQNLELRLTEP